MKPRKPVKVILTASVVVMASSNVGHSSSQPTTPQADTAQKWERIEAAYQAGKLKANGITKTDGHKVIAQSSFGNK